MDADQAISQELQLLLQRADTVRMETYRLLAENENWRNRAADQLQHMFSIGQEFRKRPEIEYP